MNRGIPIRMRYGRVRLQEAIGYVTPTANTKAAVATRQIADPAARPQCSVVAYL